LFPLINRFQLESWNCIFFVFYLCCFPVNLDQSYFLLLSFWWIVAYWSGFSYILKFLHFFGLHSEIRKELQRLLRKMPERDSLLYLWKNVPMDRKLARKWTEISCHPCFFIWNWREPIFKAKMPILYRHNEFFSCQAEEGPPNYEKNRNSTNFLTSGLEEAMWGSISKILLFSETLICPH
jgi:hypothetical protein